MASSVSMISNVGTHMKSGQQQGYKAQATVTMILLHTTTPITQSSVMSVGLESVSMKGATTLKMLIIYVTNGHQEQRMLR